MGAARFARADGGFALIEVLAATVVLAVGLIAAFQMLITATHATATDRVRQAETSVARELVEDSRSLDYTQLTPSQIASALQPLVTGSTVSGSTLTVTRSIYTFTASFNACSLDDPADGYGDHSQPPGSGGSWCPDVAGGGIQDSTPDDYKRVSVTVAPTGARTTPTVQQTTLIYAKVSHAPAVSCLTVSATGGVPNCPGTNQTYTSGTQLAFYVKTTVPAASVEWLVNGGLPSSSQLPAGAVDPYTPSGTTSTFTWIFPSADGTYTISALAFDSNGNSGTKSLLQIKLNLHAAAPPATVSAGWDQQIGGVDIQWVPSTDQDVLYYNVYSQPGNNPATLVCSAVNGTSCSDLNAASPTASLPATCSSSSQSYTTTNYYWVTAVDSDPTTGQPREGTQQSPSDDANLCDHPPSAPTNLAGTLSGGQMTLNWSAPPSPVDPDSWDSIEFWRIYRWSGTGPSFPGSRLDLVGALNASGNQVTSYTDTSPDPGGVPQSYCVTAVDTHMDESPCSNAVTG